MFRILAEHGVQYVLIGSLAATLHGSPLRTGDADICPALAPENLDRLGAALRAMDARIRGADAPEGLPFTYGAGFFRNVEPVNLTTKFGDLGDPRVRLFKTAALGGDRLVRERGLRSDQRHLKRHTGCGSNW